MENEKWLIDANVVRHKINAFAASVVYRGNDEMFNGKDTCNPYEYTRGYERGILDAQKIVCGQDTVDAVEVVHAKWLYDSGSGKNFCSDCYEYALSFKKDTLYGGDLYEVCLTDYCPSCGAKMDGGNEDGTCNSI